jgi:hypothetical protein
MWVGAGIAQPVERLPLDEGGFRLRPADDDYLVENWYESGNSSAGRASASQAEGRGFDPRFPLQRGDIAKWQGKGLQNPHPRFESGCRLHFFLLVDAGVAELADAADLKSASREGVPVRFRSPALATSRRSHFLELESPINWLSVHVYPYFGKKSVSIVETPVRHKQTSIKTS